MPITQNTVQSNINKIFDDINDKKAAQFVNAVLSVAGNLSKTKAPIEFGTLQNSQAQSVKTQNSMTIGELSYNTDYAVYLNVSKNWRPRPPTKKKGNAWNPNATPRFLEYGFESDEAKASQDKLINIFRV